MQLARRIPELARACTSMYGNRPRASRVVLRRLTRVSIVRSTMYRCIRVSLPDSTSISATAAVVELSDRLMDGCVKLPRQIHNGPMSADATAALGRGFSPRLSFNCLSIWLACAPPRIA